MSKWGKAHTRTYAEILTRPLCLQGGGALQIGDLQFMVAGEEDSMMIKGALPKGTVRE